MGACREDLVGHGGQGKFVGALVELVTVHLLGRHVADSAATCLAEALRVGELGDAEVADLAGPVAVHENVVGFDVEMQDLVLMCEFDGIADGEDDCRGDVEIEGRGRRVVDDLREGRPFDGLHDEEGFVVDGVEVVDAHDGRTAEHCTRPRLGKTGMLPLAHSLEMGMRLIATRRCMRVSQQISTLPLPPSPLTSMGRYRSRINGPCI